MVVSSGMPGEWLHLSPREREVALLVARGLANKEIARELGLSKRDGQAARPQDFSEAGGHESGTNSSMGSALAGRIQHEALNNVRRLMET
jgi:FixJ family two-component response regulator